MEEKLFFKKKQNKSDDFLDDCCPKLSYKERVIGFVICSVIGCLLILSQLSIDSYFLFLSFILGWVFSILAIITFFSRRKGIAFFAVMYTVGNIICIAGTCFLSGPKSQCKAMKHKSRIVATIVYILSMIGTLVFALVIKITILCVIFIILQFISYCWYTLSYMPFAKRIFKKICCSCFDKKNVDTMTV